MYIGVGKKEAGYISPFVNGLIDSAWQLMTGIVRSKLRLLPKFICYDMYDCMPHFHYLYR